MELRHLRYFVVLAEELHFRRAAERLHISQPPLSLQIKHLEKDIGAELFIRDRRGVELTSAGREFLLHARTTLAAAEEARRAASRAATGETGELRIGVTQSSLLLEGLGRAVRRYSARFPGVRVSFVELDSMAQIAALNAGRLDVGLLHDPGDAIAPSVELSHLCEDPLLVAVPLDHTLAGAEIIDAAELEGAAFICTPQASGSGLYRQVVRICWRAGFAPQIVHESHNLATVVTLVSMGLGVSIVPVSTRQLDVGGVRYVPLRVTDAPAAFYVAHRVRGRSSTADTFRTMLLAAQGAAADPMVDLGSAAATL